ncbi:MAG: hypothetical protein ABW091_15540 [Microbacterium sp.]
MPASTRSRSLLTWLPAIILVVVIGAIVFVTFAVQNSWWAEESPAASADQKASDGSTMLTDAGFDYATVEGIVRVRIGDGGLPAAQLGLGADEEKSAEFRRPLRVVVAGGDDVFVVDDVASLTARAADGRLTALSVTYDVPGTWAEGVARVRGLASTYGWDATQIDGLDEALAEFNRSGEGDQFAASVGPSDGGARVTATLAFDRGSGLTSVTLLFEPGS